MTAGAGTDERVDTGVARRRGPHRRRRTSTGGPRRRPASREALLEQVVSDLAAAAPDWVEAACARQGARPDRATRAGEELLASVGVLATARPAAARARSARSTAHGRPRIPGPLRHVPGGRVVAGVRAALRVRPHAARPAARRGLDAAGGLARGGRRGPGRRLPGPRGAPRASRSCSARATSARSGPTTCSTSSSSTGRWSCSRPTRSTTTSSSTGSAPCARSSTRACCASSAAAPRRAAHLVGHSLVDEVHVTGSDKTYEAIVFGPGEEGARRKAAGVRAVTKPVTAELGSVSPVIVVPGTWSREGPLLPGRSRRVDAREQRGLQLPHAAACS